MGHLISSDLINFYFYFFYRDIQVTTVIMSKIGLTTKEILDKRETKELTRTINKPTYTDPQV